MFLPLRHKKAGRIDGRVGERDVTMHDGRGMSLTFRNDGRKNMRVFLRDASTGWVETAYLEGVERNEFAAAIVENLMPRREVPDFARRPGAENARQPKWEAPRCRLGANLTLHYNPGQELVIILDGSGDENNILLQARIPAQHREALAALVLGQSVPDEGAPQSLLSQDEVRTVHFGEFALEPGISELDLEEIVERVMTLPRRFEMHYLTRHTQAGADPVAALVRELGESVRVRGYVLGEPAPDGKGVLSGEVCVVCEVNPTLLSGACLNSVCASSR